ncbi:MAG: tetratricopeptide repeat protein [Elusimicrobiota bacterium]
MKPALGAAVLGFALAWSVQPALRRGLREFPPLSRIPVTPYSLQDAVLASAGMRALAADLAWIQMLQYLAGDLPEMTDTKPFEHIKDLSLRVARLDPAFHRAYLFGASILAFFPEVDRPEDAIEVLREGMLQDPGQPLYPVYIAALAYKKRGDADRMIAVLEPTLADPKSPIEMKAIIANLYKSRGEYGRALALWNGILDSDIEAREWPRARIQVAEIKRLMKERRSAPPRRQ